MSELRRDIAVVLIMLAVSMFTIGAGYVVALHHDPADRLPPIPMAEVAP